MAGKANNSAFGENAEIPSARVAKTSRNGPVIGVLNADMYLKSLRRSDRELRTRNRCITTSSRVGLLVDQKKLGDIGDPGFELYHAGDAFLAVAGPRINGYAFGDVGSLTQSFAGCKAKRRPCGVAFVAKQQWRSINAQLNSGLGKLAGQLPRQKDQIAQQRLQNGTQARFSHLSSKRFPAASRRRLVLEGRSRRHCRARASSRSRGTRRRRRLSRRRSHPSCSACACATRSRCRPTRTIRRSARRTRRTPRLERQPPVA